MLSLLQFFFLLFSSSLLLHTSCTDTRCIFISPCSWFCNFPLTITLFRLYGIFVLIQIINVYNQQYESAAAFWPHVHSRIIASLLISQLLLLGLLSTKKAANSTPLLVALPILTLTFHKYCKNRFEPAFRKYPLEVSSKIRGSIGLDNGSKRVTFG